VSLTTLPLGPAVSARRLSLAECPARVETIEEPAAFAALREEWSALLEGDVRRTHVRSTPVFFRTWEWQHTWWTHLSAGRRLRLLTVRRGRELLAIAPFASTGHHLGLPAFELLGSGRVGSDYLDLIVRPGAEEAAVSALSAHLAARRAVLDLVQVLPDALATALGRELHGSGAAMYTARTHSCPFIDLRGHTWDSYLASLGAEHRYNFRRRLRKLEGQHGLRFEAVTSEAMRRERLPILFELHRLRWQDRGGSDGLEGDGIAAFHEDMSRVALERGWLRLFVLWLGATPAAAVYGFRYGDVFHFYQSGLDPRFAKLSVGLVALGLAIKSAIDEGAATFDLLHGEEAYKFHWAKEARSLERVRVLPPGLRGRLLWGQLKAAEAARALRRRMRRG